MMAPHVTGLQDQLRPAGQRHHLLQVLEIRGGRLLHVDMFACTERELRVAVYAEGKLQAPAQQPDAAAFAGTASFQPRLFLGVVEEQALGGAEQDRLRFYLLQIARITGENG